MPTPDAPNFAERLELCHVLMPNIVRATVEYAHPDHRHPYLEALAKGGLITSHTDIDTVDTEHITIHEAWGVGPGGMADCYEEIGIPEEVAATGQLWDVMKQRVAYEKGGYDRPIVKNRHRDDTDQALAYWDGSQWHTRRRVEDYDRGAEMSEQWEESELTDDEKAAIKSVAAQTADVHRIGETFNGFLREFEDMMLGLPFDEDILNVLRGGLGAEDYPYIQMPAYMYEHRIAYQGWKLVQAAATLTALAEGRPVHLDSGSILAANYRLSSLPPTPEMIESGLVPERMIHPPIPADF